MNNKGMTLVEVMAGFMLLVVVMTSFIKIIDLSSKLTQISADTKKNRSEFEKKYYEGINYDVTYTGGGQTGTKKAFREQNNSVIPDFGLGGDVFIAECTLDDSGKDFVERTDVDKNIWTFGDDKKMKINNAEVIQIENLYDTSIARQKVIRYYIDPTYNSP